MKNKNGFTLVELLAVIVILAVIMLVAVTSIGPMMEKSRKSSLGTEGLALIKAADTAYRAEGLKGAGAEYTSTSSVCYTVKYLCSKGYFEKGCVDDGYNGSVLVEYKSGGEYSYVFWLTNGTYVFNGATKDNYGDIDNKAIVYDGKKASETCGKTLPDDAPTEAIDHNNEIQTELSGKAITECSNDKCGIGSSVAVNVEKTIPVGGKYTKSTGEVYNAGDTIPESYIPIIGDTYETDEYVYKYNNSYALDHWINNPDVNGWGVAVKDTTKTSYGAMLSSINGKDVKNLNYTFNECYNLITPPPIPSTVTQMVGTFKKCTSLTTPPTIPDGVVNINLLCSGCSSLVETPIFPDSIKSMEWAFEYCSSLKTVHELSANTYSMGYAFQYCTSLETVPDLPPKTGTVLYTFYKCTSLQKAPVIPESTITLYYAFAGCSSLKGTLTINSKSISMGEGTLSGVAKDSAHAITINGSASTTIKEQIKATAYKSGQYVTVN